MPRAARRKGRRGDAAGEPPQADATQAECAVHAALRAALRGAGADAGDMRLGLATEFVIEALSGPGLQTEGEDVRSLEELLGSAMESVEVCAGADERAAAAQSLLDSGEIRWIGSVPRRLRLEQEAAAEVMISLSLFLPSQRGQRCPRCAVRPVCVCVYVVACAAPKN